MFCQLRSLFPAVAWRQPLAVSIITTVYKYLEPSTSVPGLDQSPDEVNSVEDPKTLPALTNCCAFGEAPRTHAPSTAPRVKLSSSSPVFDSFSSISIPLAHCPPGPWRRSSTGFTRGSAAGITTTRAVEACSVTTNEGVVGHDIRQHLSLVSNWRSPKCPSVVAVTVWGRHLLLHHLRQLHNRDFPATSSAAGSHQTVIGHRIRPDLHKCDHLCL